MGSPPPPDLPAPSDPTAAEPVVSAGFAPGPPAISLCGFSLPIPRFVFGFNLPSISFPPKLPFPPIPFALGITCNLSNPIDISAGLPYGGGRAPNHDPDPDLNEATS